MINLDYYRKEGGVKDLVPNEKEQYISFLNVTYEDNLKASEFLLIKFPRWCIISGYYAMHDISKLYLARRYGLKFSQPKVHAAVIQALRELVKKEDIIKLMEKAEEEYDEIISLHLALIRGRDEREKSQYYTSSSITPEVAVQKASYFLEKLVKPYIKIIRKMVKDDI